MADLHNTFGGAPLLDPATLLQECLDRKLPTDHWLGKVTVASVPPGREPGTATFLMRRGDLRTLSRTQDYSLILSDFEEPVELKGWSIQRAEAVVSGMASDDETAYLVRAVDYRWHYRRSPFSKAYNVTTDGTTYVASTENSGMPWTWAQMVADLWSLLPGAPGVPTLPFTPHGTPQNFSFFGHPSAWDALNDVMDRLACVLTYDPVAYAFGIERLGNPDAGATAFELAAKDDKVWDSFPQNFNRVDRPEKVRIVFRRMPIPAPGSDTTYAVVVTLPATAGTVAGTTVQIEDDAIAYGPATPTNATYLAARAAERADDYRRKLEGIPRRLTRSYRGTWKAASAAGGSVYSEVVWEDRGAGLCTELASGKEYGDSDWDMDRLNQGLPTSGGGTVTLDVQNTDGSQHTTAVTGLKADKTSGVGWTLSGSVETLAGIDAAASQKGMANIGVLYQQLGNGVKGTDANFHVNTGKWDWLGSVVSTSDSARLLTYSNGDYSNTTPAVLYQKLYWLDSTNTPPLFCSIADVEEPQGFPAGSDWGGFAHGVTKSGHPWSGWFGMAGSGTTINGHFEGAGGLVCTLAVILSHNGKSQIGAISGGQQYLSWRGDITYVNGAGDTIREYKHCGFVYKVTKNGVDQALGASV